MSIMSCGELLGEARLGQRPGHGERGAEDHQDRAAERRRLHQHAVELARRDAAIKQDADDDRVEHRDGRHLRRGRDAAADRAADEEGQHERRRRDRERCCAMTREGRPAHARQILAAAPSSAQARASAASSTMATTKPLVNSPAIDTPATEPSTISTMLGGTVSAMAAPVESSAIISLGLCPRRFISGNSAGATVAMSDTLEPEMPETRNSEPSST